MFDGGEDGEYCGIGFVVTSNIFLTQDNFVVETAPFERVVRIAICTVEVAFIIHHRLCNFPVSAVLMMVICREEVVSWAEAE